LVDINQHPPTLLEQSKPIFKETKKKLKFLEKYDPQPIQCLCQLASHEKKKYLYYFQMKIIKKKIVSTFYIQHVLHW